MQLAVVLPPVTNEIEQTNEIKRKKERTKSNERTKAVTCQLKIMYVAARIAVQVD